MAIIFIGLINYLSVYNNILLLQDTNCMKLCGGQHLNQKAHIMKKHHHKMDLYLKLFCRGGRILIADLTVNVNDPLKIIKSDNRYLCCQVFEAGNCVGFPD